jgi:hypothetical protein
MCGGRWQGQSLLWSFLNSCLGLHSSYEFMALWSAIGCRTAFEWLWLCRTVVCKSRRSACWLCVCVCVCVWILIVGWPCEVVHEVQPLCHVTKMVHPTIMLGNSGICAGSLCRSSFLPIHVFIGAYMFHLICTCTHIILSLNCWKLILISLLKDIVRYVFRLARTSLKKRLPRTKILYSPSILSPSTKSSPS